MPRVLTTPVTALVFVLTCSASCDRSQQMRSTLSAQKSDWSRQLSVLQQRGVELEVRLRSLPSIGAGEDGAVEQAQRRRLEASIAGSRQSLTDVDHYVAQSAGEVEAAISRNEAEGEEALSALRTRMSEHLQRQDEELAVSEAALTRMAQAF